MAAAATRAQRALAAAAAHGQLAVVELLLSDSRVDPSHASCEALVRSAEAGHVAIVRRLLLEPRLAMSESVEAALIAAAVHRQLEAARALLSNESWSLSPEPHELGEALDYSASEPLDALSAAACNNDVDIGRLLLADSRIDPKTNGSRCIRAAVQHGAIDFLRLLLSDGRANPQAISTWRVFGKPALTIASALGMWDVADLLLDDPRVTSGEGWGIHLASAAGEGHLEFAERMLTDSRLKGRKISLSCALLVAAASGHSAIADRLLRDSRCNAAVHGVAALHAAAKAGHIGVVEVLLADARIDPCIHDVLPMCSGRDAVSVAAAAGRVAVMDRLLSDPRVAASTDCTTLLLAATSQLPELRDNDSSARTAGIIAVLDRLLADPRTDPSGHAGGEALKLAAASGSIEVLQRLLADDRIEVAACGRGAFAMAALQGRVSVMRLLLHHPRVTFTPAYFEPVLSTVAQIGRAEVVDLLLREASVDPSASDNDAIVRASESGHSEIVAMLLADTRVNPAANGNAALRAACRMENIEVVELLLGDRRVDPSVSDDIVALAAGAGREHLVRWLLADVRIDPAWDACSALEAAASQNNATIVQMILDHPNVAAAMSARPLLLRTALERAAAAGLAEVAAILLADPRLGPEVQLDDLLVAAARGGSPQLIAKLLADPRVNAARACDAALHAACTSGRAAVVQLLLARVNTAAPLPAADLAGSVLAMVGKKSMTSEQAVPVLQALLADDRASWDIADGGDSDLYSGLITCFASRRQPLPTYMLQTVLQGYEELSAAARSVGILRRVVSLNALWATAWARRRAIVLARATALKATNG